MQGLTQSLEVMNMCIHILTLHFLEGRELSQSVVSHGVDILHYDVGWWILHKRILVLPKRVVSLVIGSLRSILSKLILSPSLLNFVSNLLNLFIVILSDLIVPNLLWCFHSHKLGSYSSPIDHGTPYLAREENKNKKKL